MPKHFYRIVGRLDSFANYKRCVWFNYTARHRNSIDAVCAHCTSEIILIMRTPELDARYYWVRRGTREVLAEVGDRDAAEMAVKLGAVR